MRSYRMATEKSMSTRKLVIIGSILIGLIVLLSLLFSFLRKPDTEITSSTPTPSPVIFPNTNLIGEAQKEKEYELSERPDLFLSNNCPYSTPEFEISYTFEKEPEGHFAFTVDTRGNRDQGTRALGQWLRSLGLSEAAISSLDITYR